MTSSFVIKTLNINTENSKIIQVVEPNITKNLINELKIKPTNLLEWKRRHYLTGYLNKNQKVKIYIISGQWYGRMDIHHLKYNYDGTLINCNLTPEELRTADALFCVDQQILPEKKSCEGQKFIQLAVEPYITCPWCIDNLERWDFRSTYNENSDMPTSLIRSDPNGWRIKQPFNVESLNKNSTLVSFIASHWTDFRRDW
ncbi:2661_t:CDS:2, partial [Dentiscutata erythropus]